jgi:hypothetical protein
MSAERDALHAQVLGLIDRLAGGARDDAARDALLAALMRYQRRSVAPYARVVQNLGGGEDPLRWPALPTDVFRHARVASHATERDVRVFRTSGTTQGARGAHALCDLSLYDRAARAAARYALFPDVERMPLAILAPRASTLPDSSLSYMLDRFAAWFGAGETAWLIDGDRIDAAGLERAARAAERSGAPLALLGTSFAFVHAEDALGERRFRLPHGSRIMQTGGFKGRVRTIEPSAMLELLSARYGVEPAFIVQEYGMTELSSQLYEAPLRAALRGEPVAPRRLWVPGWVRATVVDADTLAEVPPGHEGLLRVDDPCNLDTVCAIQTSDRARTIGDGIVVLGRAPLAEARGCSIAIDAALGG